jgi:hypothetical protein
MNGLLVVLAWAVLALPAPTGDVVPLPASDRPAPQNPCMIDPVSCGIGVSISQDMAGVSNAAVGCVTSRIVDLNDPAGDGFHPGVSGRAG